MVTCINDDDHCIREVCSRRVRDWHVCLEAPYAVHQHKQCLAADEDEEGVRFSIHIADVALQ